MEPSEIQRQEPAAAAQQAADVELRKLLAKELSQVPVRNGQFSPASLEGYQRLAKAYIIADLVPYTLTNKRTQEQLLACVTLILEAGARLGFSCTQSLANIMVVNNRPALWGDALPALLRTSGLCAGINETIEGTGDDRAAVCRMTRLNKMVDGSFVPEVIERRFSVKDAKAAKLWMKKGYNDRDTPWITHPDRMLTMRARAFAARDGFADVLMGLGVAEELGAELPSPELLEARERAASLAPVPVEPTKAPVEIVPVKPAFEGIVEAITPEAPKPEAKKHTAEQLAFLASMGQG